MQKIMFDKIYLLMELNCYLEYNCLNLDCFYKYLNYSSDEDYIDMMMILLNKYNRVDLIAILLDRKKGIETTKDFEL